MSLRNRLPDEAEPRHTPDELVDIVTARIPDRIDYPTELAPLFTLLAPELAPAELVDVSGTDRRTRPTVGRAGRALEAQAVELEAEAQALVGAADPSAVELLEAARCAPSMPSPPRPSTPLPRRRHGPRPPTASPSCAVPIGAGARGRQCEPRSPS